MGKWTVKPKEVRLFGPANLLEKIDHIRTKEEISISSQTRKFTKKNLSLVLFQEDGSVFNSEAVGIDPYFVSVEVDILPILPQKDDKTKRKDEV